LKKPKSREKESELKKKLKLKFGDLKKEKPWKRLKQLLLKKMFLKWLLKVIDLKLNMLSKNKDTKMKKSTKWLKKNKAVNMSKKRLKK
jgi:hypothetical protein